MRTRFPLPPGLLQSRVAPRRIGCVSTLGHWIESVWAAESSMPMLEVAQLKGPVGGNNRNGRAP